MLDMLRVMYSSILIIIKCVLYLLNMVVLFRDLAQLAQRP